MGQLIISDVIMLCLLDMRLLFLIPVLTYYSLESPFLKAFCDILCPRWMLM